MIDPRQLGWSRASAQMTAPDPLNPGLFQGIDPALLQGVVPAAPQEAAPVNAPAMPGGGLGGGIASGLGSLFERIMGGQPGMNQTYAWLTQERGVDPGMARLMVRDPGMMRGYIANASKGTQPIEINGQLVNPQTGQVMGDYRDKDTDPDIKVIDGHGYNPATGEWLTPPGAGQPGYTFLSPEEIKQAGLPPGTYQRDKEGKVTVVGGVRDQDAGMKREQDLRKEYSARPEFKRYDEARAAYERVRSAATRADGAGDVGLIFSYMKLLDPGSVVREGEFATAQETAGVPGQVVNLYNRLINGERLTPEQRASFVELAGDLYENESARLDEFNGQYQRAAKAAGVKPRRVIVRPKQYEPFGDTDAPKAPPDLSAFPSPEQFDALPPDEQREWLEKLKQLKGAR